jgi:hypothetical protein
MNTSISRLHITS